MILIKKIYKSFFTYFAENVSELFFISLPIAILFALLSSNYLFVFLVLSIPMAFLFLNEKTLIILSIVFFISTVGDFFENIRNYFTIASLILLFLFFLKKYGIDIKSFPKPTGLFIYLVIILITSISLSTALTGFNAYSVYAIIRAIVFLLICYFLYAFLEEKLSLSNVYVLLGAIFIASLLLSVSVYYDLIRSGFLLFVFDLLITRWAGAFGNPNSLALIISINIVFIITLLYSEKISRKIKTTLIPFLLLNNTIILILTNSRAAILALFISLLFLFYFLERKIIIYFLCLIFIGILLYTFEPFFQSLIDLYLRLETVPERHYLWNSGFEVVKDYPLFGVGPELYPTIFWSYVPTSGSYLLNLYVILSKPHPHNYSLWIIAEMGILGWICAFSIFGFYFYMSAKLIRMRRSHRDEIYLFALSLFAIGVMVFVRSFFEVEGIFSYGYISRDLPFWICYVVLAFLYKNHNNIITEKN